MQGEGVIGYIVLHVSMRLKKTASEFVQTPSSWAAFLIVPFTFQFLFLGEREKTPGQVYLRVCFN